VLLHPLSLRRITWAVPSIRITWSPCSCSFGAARRRSNSEAPALAHADFRVDRIAIGGVVSDLAALGDSAASRESWSSLIGDRLGREKFGKLPIMSYSEMGAILGPGDQALMLDYFKEAGECEDDVLAGLKTVLEGKARFIVFGNIQADQIDRAEKESEVVDEKQGHEQDQDDDHDSEHMGASSILRPER
jgi:hypothetical protein